MVDGGRQGFSLPDLVAAAIPRSAEVGDGERWGSFHLDPAAEADGAMATR